MFLMNPELALMISIIIVVSLILKKIDISISLGAGLIIYTIFAVSDLDKIYTALIRTFDLTLFTALTSLIQAMFLADLYRLSGVADKMVRGLICAGHNFAGVSIPAIIGLLPMPGGAYISAVLADPVYKDQMFESEAKTFINYWFRHIWIPIWPLYQNIIIAIGLLGMSVRDILNINWVITFSSILSGLIIFIFIKRFSLKNASQIIEKRDSCDLKGIYHLWPFILIAVLNLVMGVYLPLSIFITIIIFIILYRPDKDVILKALKYAFNLSLIMLIFEVFVFGNMIRVSDIASRLSNILSGHAFIATLAVPFVIGFATAAEFAYVALAFPPFIDLFHHNLFYLTLAFLGGYMGVMLSPSHACLVLSAKYYETHIVKPFKYIIPAVILTILLTIGTDLVIRRFII